MYLLYCDESNMEPRSGDFLIYAGLMVSSGRLLSLHSAIEQLRNRFSVPRDYRLKFNPGPTNLSHPEFIEFKKSIIQIAVEHEVKIITYLILHDIAAGADLARRNGINTVCYHFHCLLGRLKEIGVVLVDRFTDEGNQIEAHLREKFSIGLVGMPFSPELRLTNIVGFHYSVIGQSHMASIADVVIGSIRLAINAHTRNSEQSAETARAILTQIEPMFWRESAEDPVSELSFMFSPKSVLRTNYRSTYRSLQQFLSSNGIDTQQEY